MGEPIGAILLIVAWLLIFCQHLELRSLRRKYNALHEAHEFWREIITRQARKIAALESELCKEGEIWEAN